jgi:hypothetical protein
MWLTIFSTASSSTMPVRSFAGLSLSRAPASSMTSMA